MKNRKIWLVMVIFSMTTAITTAMATAQDSGNESVPPAVPCGQPEAAQFDFWLGEWEVLAKDKVVGRNEISRIHGGCTLLEKYEAVGGKFEGGSFNYFDPTDGHWHQVWVDNSGTRLHLTGGFADGKMVMSGERMVKGKAVVDRISWTDNADGTVRQLWELSGDGGEIWQVLFDGLYRHPEQDASKEHK